MSRFFGSPIQTAFVVRNIDEHIARCLEIGIGPFYVSRNLTVRMRYRGERHEAPVTIAIAYSGSMMYEYLEPGDSTPSPYSDFLARHPEGGIHHFAYFCDNYDEALERAKARGGEFDVAMELYGPAGDLIEKYIEPKGRPDGYMAQLLVEGPYSNYFDKMEAISANWDGSEPVRDLFDLISVDAPPSTT